MTVINVEHNKAGHACPARTKLLTNAAGFRRQKCASRRYERSKPTANSCTMMPPVRRQIESRSDVHCERASSPLALFLSFTMKSSVSTSKFKVSPSIRKARRNAHSMPVHFARFSPEEHKEKPTVIILPRFNESTAEDRRKYFSDSMTSPSSGVSGKVGNIIEMAMRTVAASRQCHREDGT